MSETWGDRLRVALHKVVARFSYGVTHYRHPLRKKALIHTNRMLKRIPIATLPIECVELFQAVAACEKIHGDMAEAGVYRGGTAALMLSASKKRLHLFDTFEGLPHGEDKFEKGEWAGSRADVEKNLGEWLERVELHPGLFPASAAEMDGHRFSFVHLDLDLYDSTRAALEWFWPRLEIGGILLSHDYPYSAGVVRAFHEFFDGRAEPFLPLSGNQCIAIKTQPSSVLSTQ